MDGLEILTVWHSALHTQHTPTAPFHMDCVTVPLGLTVLAVQYPGCVIGIREPGLWPSFKGRFRNCIFFHDEELAFPTKFICGAWWQCQLWTDEGYALRRSVEVTMSEQDYFTVTLTACKDADGEDQRWPEESTGYIFQLDAGGELVL